MNSAPLNGVSVNGVRLVLTTAPAAVASPSRRRWIGVAGWLLTLLPSLTVRHG